MFKTGKIAKTLAAAFTYAGVTLHDGAASEAVPPHAFMKTSYGTTSIPIGHHEFCAKREFAAQCNVKSADTAPMVMDVARWIELNEVNRIVNENVSQVTDKIFYGVDELWAYPDGGVGDCEDIALEKRRLLLDLGWHESQLLMTVLKQSNGEGHAILTARTDGGDYILDNLDANVLRWDEAAAFNGYTFLKRQSESHTGQWRDIRNGAPDDVAYAVSAAAPSP